MSGSSRHCWRFSGSMALLALALIAPGVTAAPLPAGHLRFNEAEFRDKVHACWLGKAIGGTLGMPFEGVTTPIHLTGLMHQKEGEPAANDDLDLQLLWLKALEEHDGQVDAVTLARYWTRHVGVDWNEYGIGIANINRGILPPLSGLVDNPKWKDSNGAWIRTEIWALLAAGQPLEAARMAREDACVDHGNGEGTIAALFVAAIESAAFVEHDRERLVAYALNAVPSGSQTAAAVRAVMGAWRTGKTPDDARRAAIAATDPGILDWYPAPTNVAYVVLGLMYGDGDFGRSLLLAVNNGDDTDCTGATLGSILGILGGTKAIPDVWKRAVGDRVVTECLKGMTPPATISELTDRTVAMARRIWARGSAAVLTSAVTDLSSGTPMLEAARGRFHTIWEQPAHRVSIRTAALDVSFDYGRLPFVRDAEPFPVTLEVTNASGEPVTVMLQADGVPVGARLEGLTGTPAMLAPGAKRTWRLVFIAPTLGPGPVQMTLRDAAAKLEIPFTLFKLSAPAPVVTPARAFLGAGQSVRMSIENAAAADVRYTLDGSDPDGRSPRYADPFDLGATTVVKAQSFLAGATPSDVVTALIEVGDQSAHGLSFSVFDGDFYTDLGFVDQFFQSNGTMTPVTSGRSAGPQDLARLLKDKWDFRGIVWDGFLNVDTEADYTLFLEGYTRARLVVDGSALVSKGTEVSTTQHLSRGPHSIRIEYAHYYHGASLTVDIASPSLSRRPLPSAWLTPGRAPLP
jgi:ADP-ribosylglycohydrolase